MSQRPLFRQSALERLESAERLDTLAGLTTRKLGLVLLAAGVLVLVVVLWWLVDHASAAVVSAPD